MLNLKLYKELLIRMHARMPPILTLSGPGLGKTAVTRQATFDLARLTRKYWGYQALILSNYDPFDVNGFLVPRAKGDRLVSLFTEPFWWEEVMTWDGVDRFGFLHLDEMPDAEKDMQKIAAQMVFARMCGNRPIPKGCWILLSGNRRKDKSGVNALTTMFQNRLRTIELEYNSDIWLEYERNEVSLNPLALAFAAQAPGVIYNDTVPADPGPFCSPRSYQEGVLDLMHLADSMGLVYPRLPGIDDPGSDEGRMARNLFAGAVGEGACSQAYAYWRYADQLPTLDEIALAPDKAKLPDNPGGQFMLAYTIGASAQDRHLEACMKYLLRMRVEFQVTAMRSLFDRSNNRNEIPGLQTTKGVSQWFERHKAVLKLSY